MRKNILRNGISLLILLAVSSPSMAQSRTIPETKKALIGELMRVSNVYATENDVFLQLFIIEVGNERHSVPTEADVASLRKEVTQDATARRLIDTSLMPLYDKRFSEEELKSLIAFFKTGAGKKLAELQTDLQQEGWTNLHSSIVGMRDPNGGRRRMQLTKANLLTLGRTLEAYAVDNGKYPQADGTRQLATLLSPHYVIETPQNDGWDHPFAFMTSADRQEYRFVSGGLDGKIDRESLVIGGKPRPGSDDVIYENGQFVSDPDAEP